MNLQQLRYAVEVAKTGSITAAAKNLYMGQPNLSKSIRELEAELGITLFERTARGVAPTKNGEDFLGYARSIIAQMESLETKPAFISSVTPPHSTHCSPNRSVSVSSRKEVSRMPARPAPMPLA